MATELGTSASARPPLLTSRDRSSARAAYLDEESWDSLQLTAWVPLLDTSARNGCMQVVRGGHTPGVTATHACCVGGTWYVESTPSELETTLGVDMDDDVVTCEVGHLPPSPAISRHLPQPAPCRPFGLVAPPTHVTPPHPNLIHNPVCATCQVPLGSVLLLNNLIPHRSLPNLSEGIRWSLDLRWQRGGEPNGFHGLKPSMLMKRAGDEYNGSVAWGAWAAQERDGLQKRALRGEAGEEVEKLRGVDTTIAGPWMQTWPLIHQNRHTANWRPSRREQEQE